MELLELASSSQFAESFITSWIPLLLFNDMSLNTWFPKIKDIIEINHLELYAPLQQFYFVEETCEGLIVTMMNTFLNDKQLVLEMIHFTGDIFEKLVLQHLLPFYISMIFHFSRQKLVLR